MGGESEQEGRKRRRPDTVAANVSAGEASTVSCPKSFQSWVVLVMGVMLL